MKLFFWLNLFMITFVSCSSLMQETSFNSRRTHRSIAQNPERTSKEVHLVLDIDWTIVRPLETGDLADFNDTGRVINLGKEDHYLLMEGVEELLDFARENPWLKVSFFSGGHYERNIRLLNKIKDSQGNTARALATKILSNEDLTVVSEDPNLRFSQRLKKDLKKAHQNLDEVIFVDDLEWFALDNGGRERTAWIGKTFHPWPEGMEFNEYERYWLSRGKKPEHIAPDKEAVFWAKNKIFMVLGAIESNGNDPEAIHQSLKSLDLSRTHFTDDHFQGLLKSPSFKKFLKTKGCPVPNFLNWP